MVNCISVVPLYFFIDDDDLDLRPYERQNFNDIFDELFIIETIKSTKDYNFSLTSIYNSIKEFTINFIDSIKYVLILF